MALTVVGVYDTHERAVEAVRELRGAGIPGEEISIFAPDPREPGNYSDELGAKVLQAGGTGLAAGGVLGALSGLAAGLTGLAIPGIGPFVAAGPLAGAIAGLVGGASVGGFAGLLVGLGLPRDAAEEYQRQLQEGRTLVFVHPDGDFALAEATLGRAQPLSLRRFDRHIGRLEDLPEEMRTP